MAAATAGVVATSVAKEYRRSQLDAVKSLPHVGANFNLKDTRAINNLSNNTMYWVKEGATRSIEPGIAKIVQEGLEQGFGRDDLAKLLKEKLGAKYKVAASRWDVVSSAALNRSRVISRIQQMSRWGTTTVRFVAVLDARTSAVCSALSGKTWEYSRIIEQTERILSAESPEEAIDAQPWYSVNSKGQWSAGKSTGRSITTYDDVVKSGAIIPPLHGRCRSTLHAEFDETVNYDERVSKSSKIVKREQKPAVTPDKDPRTVAAVLAALSLPARESAKGYTAGELRTLTATSVHDTGFLRTGNSWSVADAGAVLTTRWMHAESDALVSEFATLAGADAISVVNTSFRRMPTATWMRIADQVEELAKIKKVPASIRLDPSMASPSVAWAFKDWTLSRDDRARFKKWLEDTDRIEPLRRSVLLDAVVGGTIGTSLSVIVNGIRPIMEWLRSSGPVMMEVHP